MWHAWCVALAYDSTATWALALSLAILAGIWTFFAVRKGRPGAATRGAGLVLLPFGLLLTGTLTLLLRILDAVSLWASRLVFSPSVWLGAAMVVVSLALIFGGRALARRHAPPAPPKAAVGPASAPVGTGDPDLDEIEAILRRRGIS